MGTPDAIEATPDLTISQAAERWGVSSANTVKHRAAALGVELRRESSTRTVWPAEHVALGDRLAEHLKRPGATLRNFPEALPSVPAASAISDGVSQTAPLTPGDGANPGRARSGELSLPALAASSDALGALAQLAAVLAPPAAARDALAVARGLAEAADLGAWLSSAELADLLAVSRGTVRSWRSGHRPRPGFELERRKDRATVWWRVSASSD